MELNNSDSHVKSDLVRIIDLFLAEQNKKSNFKSHESDLYNKYRENLIYATSKFEESECPEYDRELFRVIYILLDICLKGYMVIEKESAKCLNYIFIQLLIKNQIIKKTSNENRYYLSPGSRFDAFIKSIFLIGREDALIYMEDIEDINNLVSICLRNIYWYLLTITNEDQPNTPINFFKYLLLNLSYHSTEEEIDLIQLNGIGNDSQCTFRIDKSKINISVESFSYLQDITFSSCNFFGGAVYFTGCMIEDCKFSCSDIKLEKCIIVGQFNIWCRKYLYLNILSCLYSENIKEESRKFTLRLNNVNSSNILIENAHNISLHIDQASSVNSFITKDSTYDSFEILGKMLALPNFSNIKIYSFIKVKYNNFGYADCNVFSDTLSKMGCKEAAIEYKAYALKARQKQCSTIEKSFLWLYWILNNRGKNIWLPLFWLVIMICGWSVYYNFKFYELHNIYDSLS
ncbi:MAG: hypothetical protein ACK5Z5_08770 [Neisseriaceae bacterium]